MNKQEFEERIKGSISDQNYKIIETVYNYHPSISEVNGRAMQESYIRFV